MEKLSEAELIILLENELQFMRQNCKDGEQLEFTLATNDVYKFDQNAAALLAARMQLDPQKLELDYGDSKSYFATLLKFEPVFPNLNQLDGAFVPMTRESSRAVFVEDPKHQTQTSKVAIIFSVPGIAQEVLRLVDLKQLRKGRDAKQSTADFDLNVRHEKNLETYDFFFRDLRKLIELEDHTFLLLFVASEKLVDSGSKFLLAIILELKISARVAFVMADKELRLRGEDRLEVVYMRKTRRRLALTIVALTELAEDPENPDGSFKVIIRKKDFAIAKNALIIPVKNSYAEKKTQIFKVENCTSRVSWSPSKSQRDQVKILLSCLDLGEKKPQVHIVEMKLKL